MNAALLLMSSAWMAGADTPAPAPAPAPAPYVAGAPAYAPGLGAPGYAPGAGGCGCGSGISSGCADPYVSASSGRSGLFSRLKGLCHRNNNDCGCGPVYTGFTTAACDTGCGCGSGSSRQGLFSRLKGLCHRNNNSGCCDTWGGSIGGCGTCGSVSGYGAPAYGAPGVGGCALPPVPGTVPPTTPAQPPTNMPAPTPKKSNKNGTSSTSAELPRLSPAAGSQVPAVSVPNPF